MSHKAPSPCYILAGPELGRKDAFIKELAAGCRTLDGSEPERHSLYAADTGAEVLVGLLRNGSLFSARRIVEYRGAEALTSKAQLDPLVSYLAAPAGDAVLLLVTEGYSLAKALESAVPAAARLVFWELRDSEKPAWLRTRLGADRLSADEDAVEAILELVENETQAMESACLYLAACFPPGSRLSAEDVEAALSRSRREDAFSVFDRMASGDLGSALGVLDAVLADRQSEPSQIIAALVWSFRKLRRLQELAAEGLDLDEAFRLEKLASKTAQRKFRTAARRYSAADCASALRALSETEACLRGGYPLSFARPFLHLLLRAIMTGKDVGRSRSLVLSGWKDREYYLTD